MGEQVFAVILISGDEFEENFASSLSRPAPHPWGFREWKRQMQVLQPGATLAFIDLRTSSGAQVNRFTRSNEEIFVARIVLTQVVTPIEHRRSPPFPGFQYVFEFDRIDEFTPPEQVPLEAAAAWMVERGVADALSADLLAGLVTRAKSNRVGIMIDGEEKMAPDFPDERKPASAGGEVDNGSSQGEGFAEFVSAVERAGLRFGGTSEHLPAAFAAAVATKRFVILSGLSGSGKTQLAIALGRWVSDSDDPRYLVVPVRPDWTSPDSLLGFEDALLPASALGRAWAVPDALRFMLTAAEDSDRLYVLVLDEMNLAHVERYFADLLSGIESGEPVLPNLSEDEADGYWRQSQTEKLIRVPGNLIIVGTVNVDETTYQFSPKVLDRAFTFEFRVESSSLAAARPTAVEPGAVTAVDAFRLAVVADATEAPAGGLAEKLRELHAVLAGHHLEFGYRTYQEALSFATSLASAGITDESEQLDWIVMTKLLPRVHGARQLVEPLLVDLLARAAPGDVPDWPRTAAKVKRMLTLVRANQFVSFAE